MFGALTFRHPTARAIESHGVLVGRQHFKLGLAAAGLFHLTDSIFVKRRTDAAALIAGVHIEHPDHTGRIDPDHAHNLFAQDRDAHAGPFARDETGQPAAVRDLGDGIAGQQVTVRFQPRFAHEGGDGFGIGGGGGAD